MDMDWMSTLTFKGMKPSGWAFQGAGLAGSTILGKAISKEEKKNNPDSKGLIGSVVGMGSNVPFVVAGAYGAHPNNAASILGRMWKHGEIIKDV